MRHTLVALFYLCSPHPVPPPVWLPPDFFIKLLLNDLMKRRINSAYIE